MGTPEEARTKVEYKDEDVFDIVYQFTNPIKTVRNMLKKGIDAYHEYAMDEIGDKFNVADLQVLIDRSTSATELLRAAAIASSIVARSLAVTTPPAKSSSPIWKFPHAPQPDHRHGFESFSAATNSGACAALETGPGRVHGRGIHQRVLAVRRAADVHAHGSAAARRLSIGLVGGHGVLPDHAVRRLRLRAYPDAGGAAAGRRRRPRRAAYHSRADAAFVNRRKLGRSAGPRDCVLAHRLVFGLDRAAFLRARRQ